MSSSKLLQSLRGVLGVAVLSSRWIIRQPTWLFQDIAMVAAFLVLLYAWAGMKALPYIVVAWVVGGAWSLGVNVVGQEIGWSKVQGQLQLYIASPLTPRTYLLGLTLAGLLFLILTLPVLLVLAVVVNALSVLAMGIVAGLALLPASVFASLAIAMKVEKPTCLL